MLPLATSLSLFGFYSANLTLTASYSNLYQADTIAEAQAAHAVGQKTLLLVYDAFFMSVPNQIILRPDWLSSWEALATQAAPLIASGDLYGFNLGDELVWNCLDPVNLTIAANAVRSSFPPSSGAILWYNEATPPLQFDYDGCGHKNVNFSIPLALDIFSTDLYHMNGPVVGWVENNVKSFYETYIYPRLSSSQKVMLVPGSFGSTANIYPNGSYICDQHCYDVMCALDANDFYTWAQADPRVVAVMPWNWQGCPGCKECCKDELGTNVQPLATAAWSAIGQKIITIQSSNHIKLSPKVSEAASSATLSAVLPAAVPSASAAAATIKAHEEETNFFAFKDQHDNLLMVNSVNKLEEIFGELSLKENNYFIKDKNKISLFQACCEFYKDNDTLPLTKEDVDKVFQQLLDG